MIPAAVAILVVAAGTPVAWSGQTVLVSDPVHPIPAARLAGLQRAVDRSFVPTIPGTVVVSGRVSETAACGLAGDRYIELECRTPFAILHELAHESQMFVGPGSSLWANKNFGHGAVGWSDVKIRRLARLLRIRPTSSRLVEVSADASAVCGLYGRRWRRWWGRYGRAARRGAVKWVDTSTPYDFRAGPRRYARVCRVLRMP